MKLTRQVALAAACTALAACGGNGDEVSSHPPAGVTAYPQVDPIVGSLDTFSVATVDDAGNTIARGYEERVTAVGGNGAGSYELVQDDPSNQTVTVDGLTYHFDPVDRKYGGAAANYNLASTKETLPDNSELTCTTSVQSGGHPRPFYVGQTWTTRYTVTCGSTATTYTDTGSVDAVESVTVAAGTFTALRTHGSTSWMTAGGESVVEQYQAWVDPAHAFFTLKNVTTYQRTGTVPAHYVASQTYELLSRS